MIAHVVFALVNVALAKDSANRAGPIPRRLLESNECGTPEIGGETYAYWYLRRQGYAPVARNYVSTEMKGEIDLIGSPGSVSRCGCTRERLFLPRVGMLECDVGRRLWQNGLAIAPHLAR